ncbi:MAG: DEAD/DEAH box helicase, partial [Syntrophales bacterium]|nr:DEAD/DEAH box helicase [Syntrophales bacterium]
MIKPDEIIKKLEAPLIFSSKEDFRHLALVKGLGVTITSLIKELEKTMIEMSSAGKESLLYMEDLFRDFEANNLEGKKKIIKNALMVIKTLYATIPTLGVDIPDTAHHMASAFEKLSYEVQYIKGVGPKIASLLEKKNIRSVEDLLYFFPRRYEDRRQIKSVAAAEPGCRESVIGEVKDTRLHQYGRRRVFEATVADKTGAMAATWFKGNPIYLKNMFKVGQTVLLTGEVRFFAGHKNMVHPDFEMVDEQEEDSLNFKRIVPIYSETEGLYQKTIRRITMRAIEEFALYLKEAIPEQIRGKRNMPPLQESVRSLHFPAPEVDINQFNEGKSIFHHRMIYDEFFFFELGMALKKRGQVLERGISFETGDRLVKDFIRLLPFELTNAQYRVIAELEGDMSKNFPMNRLLQGDVGSGKTVVAMAAMVTACSNGFQSALMAPTEILAAQHYQNICGWSKALGLKTALVTGSQKANERREMAKGVENGEIDIVIGTHALIQD